MNTITVTVTQIQNKDDLNIVTFASQNHSLSMMSLQLDPQIKEGRVLYVTTKATNIAIAKNFSGDISYSNQLKTKIDNIELGELLCSLELIFEDTLLESIITADSAKRMDLKKGDEVTALIKSSDLSIMEKSV